MVIRLSVLTCPDLQKGAASFFFISSIQVGLQCLTSIANMVEILMLFPPVKTGHDMMAKYAKQTVKMYAKQ